MNSQTSKTISGEATELQSCENGEERKFTEPGGHRDDLFWQNINVLEFQWRQASPCSNWDTRRVAPLLFSPGGKSLN